MMPDNDYRDGPVPARPEESAALAAAADLELAAESGLPVLISADAPDSRAIALQLDRIAQWRRGAIAVVDCRDADVLARHPLPARPGRPSVLLLQEVHALNRADQARLEQQLEAVLRLPAAERVRVVSSSSTPLFDEVLQQRFSQRLYYRLNIIHVVVREHAATHGEPPSTP